jgi:hypothetical protein
LFVQIIPHIAERPGPQYPGPYGHSVSEKNNEVTNPQRAAHEWKVNFDLMNKYREHVRKAGLIFGYHTHSDEWRNFDDAMVFDEMLRQVDARKTATTNSTWTEPSLPASTPAPICRAIGGASSPSPCISRILRSQLQRPGRCHRAQGRGSFPAVLPIGQRGYHWKVIYAGAKKGGLKLSVAEMEVRPPIDPMMAMKESADFLRTLKV